MPGQPEHHHEQPMSGGVNTVFRVGDTVRRPVGPWTPAVHALLARLAERGFGGSPRAYGIDDQGREILDFLPGEVPDYPLAPEVVSDEGLASVGRLLRGYHDATVGFAPPPDARWYFPPRGPGEVICHGDFAPHNLLFRDGAATGVIDFDTVHPGPRVWDFAWTAFCFGLSVLDEEAGRQSTLATRFRRARVLADAYRLSDGDRAALPDAVVERLRVQAALIREQAADGHPGFAQQSADGHDAGYDAAAAELAGLREELGDALRG